MRHRRRGVTERSMGCLGSMNKHTATETQYANQEVSYVRARRAGGVPGLLGRGDLGLVTAPLGYTATDDLWK